MQQVTPFPSLLGGALIGLSASLYLWTRGKVAGVSGIYGGLFRRETSDRPIRFAFVLGLLMSGLAVRIIAPGAFGSSPSLAAAVGAGLLVGFGTQLGSGCTSGHGVCGISRLSARSFMATLTFITTGIATVYALRHIGSLP